MLLVSAVATGFDTRRRQHLLSRVDGFNSEVTTHALRYFTQRKLRWFVPVLTSPLPLVPTM